MDGSSPYWTPAVYPPPSHNCRVDQVSPLASTLYALSLTRSCSCRSTSSSGMEHAILPDGPGATLAIQ